MNRKSTFNIQKTEIGISVDQLIDSQITLCDNNILDFDLIERIAEMLNSTSEANESISSFIKKITAKIKAKTSIKKLDKKENQIIQIQKLLSFLYTIILNIKSEESIIMIFKSEIFPLLLPLLKTTKNKASTETLAKIILNCFFDEYSKKFTETNNDELVSIYLNHYEQFTSLYNCPFNKLSVKSTKKFFEEFYISSFKITEITIQKQHFLLSDSLVSQSLIEILLSQEIKTATEGDTQFIYLFFHNLIKNNMENTKRNFGNQYTTLFRKDELSTEVIKHIFICLGNYCYIKSFVNPFKAFLIHSKGGGSVRNSNGELMVDKKFFVNFYFEMLTNLKSSLSVYLIVILKIIYQNVNDVFQIEKGNYAPLFTALIFNYFVSPKIQEIYGICPKGIPILSQFNRLIRNICYNTMFFEKDELYSYNDIITYCHEQLYKSTDENVIKINGEEELQEIRNASNFVLPKFLLVLNSKILIQAFDLNVDVFEEPYKVVLINLEKFIFINNYFFDEKYILVNYK